MSGFRLALGAALLWLVAQGLAAAEVELAAQPAPRLRLNQIQVLGSHNSYKLAMSAEAFAALRAHDPQAAAGLEYWHLPLAEQLDLGLRQLELDVFYDPDGQLFPLPGRGASQFVVMHVQNLDDRSSCPDLLACLQVVATWSHAHPDHVPIFITFNAKDEFIDAPQLQRPLPFGEDAWLALDAELRAGLGAGLLAPAEVFTATGLSWPRLKAARGRVLTILDETGEKRRQYVARWSERAMFATQPPGEPGAAIMILNDPAAEFDQIQALVRAGYIVRTRADADTREARSGDLIRAQRAAASGAQLISTDYYLPAAHFGTDYVVRLPGGVTARCNPVLMPADCRLTD